MKGLITVCAIIMCAMTAVIGVVLFVDGDQDFKIGNPAPETYRDAVRYAEGTFLRCISDNIKEYNYVVDNADYYDYRFKKKSSSKGRLNVTMVPKFGGPYPSVNFTFQDESDSYYYDAPPRLTYITIDSLRFGNFRSIVKFFTKNGFEFIKDKKANAIKVYKGDSAIKNGQLIYKEYIVGTKAIRRGPDSIDGIEISRNNNQNSYCHVIHVDFIEDGGEYLVMVFWRLDSLY